MTMRVLGRRSPRLRPRVSYDRRHSCVGDVRSALKQGASAATLGRTVEAPLRSTALLEEHKALGARLVPFAGWNMPVQYRPILDEARTVRTKAGLFDLGHMGRVKVTLLSGVGVGRLRWDLV